MRNSDKHRERAANRLEEVLGRHGAEVVRGDGQAFQMDDAKEFLLIVERAVVGRRIQSPNSSWTLSSTG